MREIKFRAWDKLNNNYYYNVQDIHDGIISDSFGNILENEGFIVEEYTGIKDANSVEIYENDLVKVISQYWGQLGNIYKVEFYRGAFIARNPLYDMRESIKVIGNTHQQPE